VKTRVSSDPSSGVAPFRRRALWALGLLVAVLATTLIFLAYRQPELLLNLMDVRYCG
jgi:hypothetical protein